MHQNVLIDRLNHCYPLPSHVFDCKGSINIIFLIHDSWRNSGSRKRQRRKAFPSSPNSKRLKSDFSFPVLSKPQMKSIAHIVPVRPHPAEQCTKTGSVSLA